MRRTLHAATALLVVLTCTACPAGTGSSSTPGNDPALPDACEINPGGIDVEDGAVTVEITVACDPLPRRHAIKGVLQHRRDASQAYAQLSASRWIYTIPDAEGFRVRVESRPCKAGQWRALWHVKGQGPPHPEGGSVTFDFTDSDYWPTTISKEQCWGWE